MVLNLSEGRFTCDIVFLAVSRLASEPLPGAGEGLAGDPAFRPKDGLYAGLH